MRSAATWNMIRAPWRMAGALLPLFCAGCLGTIPSPQHQLDEFHSRPVNLQLAFVTDKGRQVAFYMPPEQNPEQIPQRIAILYPGIHSVALGWLRHIRVDEDDHTGYLLIDYPGRGNSEGMMNPVQNHRNSTAALRALTAHFGVEELPSELVLLGHSFGTGAALQFAARTKVARIVLVAPFSTLRQAVARKSLLLSILMPAQIDNRQLVKAILDDPSQPPTSIVIVHGMQDDTLPFWMSQRLVAVDPQRVVLHAVPDGDHVSVLTTHRRLIFDALFGRVTPDQKPDD